MLCWRAGTVIACIDNDLARCKNSQLQYKMAIEFAELVRSLPGSPVFPNLDLNHFVQSLQRRHDQQEEFLGMVEANHYQPPTFSNTTLLQHQQREQQHSPLDSPPLSLQGQGQGSPSTSSYSPTTCSSAYEEVDGELVLPWSIPSFDDKAVVVFGCDEAKSALHDAISLPLNVPASFLTGIRAMGNDAILLHGPPGTGKTSLARHTSVDFQLPLLVVTPGMLVRKVE